MLEDPDGAPYPELVQNLWKQLRLVLSLDDLPEFHEYVVEALESVRSHE